jgi:hypothetical protein
VITPRLLVLYNFGIALLFVVIGLLSLFVFEPLVTRNAIQPPFDPSSQKAMQEETDIEKLRTRAIFYFELGRDLKRARYSDVDTLFADLRKVCFLVAVAFAIGGTLVLRVLRKPWG